MASSVEFAQEALDDIDGIVAYLGDVLRSRDALASFVNALDDVVSTLRLSACAFPLCRDEVLRGRGYRKALFGSYAALYRVEDERGQRGHAVTIVRVFHQKQDYAKLV